MDRPCFGDGAEIREDQRTWEYRWHLLEPHHGGQRNGRFPGDQERDPSHAADRRWVSDQYYLDTRHSRLVRERGLSRVEGAVRIFSKSAAIQYAAKDQIRVNSVHPGFVDTPMARPGLLGNESGKARMEATPLGRFGKPIDIAMGCLYLASDESSWAIGSELVVDGSLTAN
jgi:Enoyl-(Acyl carrier protein) reductase